jgi:Ca-activated chloride channel family protein
MTARHASARPPWKRLVAAGGALLAALTALLLFAFQAEETPGPAAPVSTPVTVPEFNGLAPDVKPIDVPPEDRVFRKDLGAAALEEAVEFADAQGDSRDFVSDRPFKGKGTYDVIGGGGGRFRSLAGGASALELPPDASAPPRRAAATPPPPAAGPAPREGPDVMIFKDHGVNPVTDTSQETHSTFALDVDTASYTLARNFLKGGLLPPKEAVRVEEFLNYFRYGDPPPAEGTFAVRLEAAPSPFRDDRHLLRVTVQARDLRRRERPPVLLVFVIDVSGSMSGDRRLGLVKRSLGFLVERLLPKDRVGIVVYGSTGRKLLDPTPVGRRDEILGVIEGLRTEGSTNLEHGLHLGYDLAAGHHDPGTTTRVVVCTDGVANNGVTDPVELLKAVKGRADKGIWLSVLGFGMGNVNDALMEKLADGGNGTYEYIDDFGEAKKVFTDKLAGMLEVVAADAKVQVEFDPRTVASFRLLGYENRHVANRDFRNDAVDAGELGAGHRVTALYELALKPEGQGRLATVRLRYREPATREVVETQESLGRGQVRANAGAASPSFRLAAAVAQFAEVLRESPHAGGATLARVLAEAEPAVRDLDRPADAAEFLDLVRKAGALRK